jgi:hypothetical protein
MSKKLVKAKIDEGKSVADKKAARDERASSWERKDYGMMSGKSKNPEIQKFLHRAKLNQIKEGPKPKLSEPIDKSIEDQMFYDDYKKKIHAEGKIRRAKIEARIANPTFVDKMKKWVGSKMKPVQSAPKIAEPSSPKVEDQPNKLAASEKTPITMTAKQAVKEHKELVNVLKSPSHKDDMKEAKKQGAELKEYKEKLDKAAVPLRSIKSGISPQSIKQQNLSLAPVKPAAVPQSSVTHISGVPVPKELHSFLSSGAIVPHEHPHREIAAKFVGDVWKRSKPEGMRISQNLLGFDANGNKEANAKPSYSTIKSEKKYAAPTPADVSAPVIINERRTNTGRHYMSGPDVISGYANGASPSGGPQPKVEKKPMKKNELAKSLKKALDGNLEKANRFETHAGMGTPEANKNPAVAAVKAHIRASNSVKSPVMGVHNNLVRGSGDSIAGGKSVSNDKRNISEGKTRHENVLSQLKSMPKPNLPKSEDMNKIDPKSHMPGTLLDKSSPEYLAKKRILHQGLSRCYATKLDKSSEGQHKKMPASHGKNPPTGHEKGVHTTVSSEGIPMSTSAGNSSAGGAVRSANAAKEGKLFYGSTHNKAPSEDASKYMDRSKQLHSDKLKELKAMPKPNLPKSEPTQKSEGLKKKSKNSLKKEESRFPKGADGLTALQRALKAKADRDELNRPHREKAEAEAKVKKEAEASRRKMHLESLLPENIKLDAPKYVTVDQHFNSTVNGKPNPLHERGQKTLQYIDDAKALNEYHGRNVITGVHNQPVKEWGSHTYLLHPTGQMDFMHSDSDTSDSRGKL